jgi:RNA polymerase sigma factor (sigma-70 family)
MSDDDITQWITDLAQGDELAARKMWERYRERLLNLAHKRLGDRHRRASDEEDVVLSAFASFCRGVSAGRYPRLDDRHDLWKLLVTITARKATAQLRREHAQKRGGGLVRGESVFLGGDGSDVAAGIGKVLGDEPSPEFALQVTEQCEHLLDCLGDESLRAVAQRKLEGYTNEEIARQLDCVPGTVERKLARIRKKWAEEAER